MDKKSGAYGAQGGGGGDTDFRKTYDREKYAALAKEREQREREEGKARYEAKQEGRSYRRRASTPEDLKMTEARTSRVDVASLIGKTMLVPAGSGVGKRGKSAGFFCEACDMTWRDHISYVEHLNSKQHLSNTGQSMDVKRATLEDVRERLRYLSRKRKEAAQVEDLDLDKRLDKRREEEEREREEKRRKRNEKRRSRKQQDDW
ncbi:U4/U6.U5 snRNP associated protein [Kalmusia sp. IMI 367209]|nr:U4/U6.U5 snRNP associated protein [Kalmusia sp. IMI 367209]